MTSSGFRGLNLQGAAQILQALLHSSESDATGLTHPRPEKQQIELASRLQNNSRAMRLRSYPVR
jgi:hypothetical protein